ncbi:outer membrane protein, partial [Sandarakinorhabdus oryzae]|uniref:outer membrane protein n=1 Tax=Sandarakinorhabdus oryzae TaxID=2675220 RepID=UPI0012E0D92C
MTLFKPKLLAGLGLVALAFTATAATARDKSWYIGLRGGVVLPTDRNFYSNTPVRPDFDTSEKRGWAAAARLGYDFGVLRTEFDVGYHQNNLRSIDLLSTTPVGDGGRYGSPTGKMRTWTAMANVLVDVINTGPFSASIGAGAGAARIDAHNVRIAQSADLLLNDSDWVFAWNALAGARLALSPGVDLAVDYRYLRPNRAYFVENGGPVTSTRRNSHTILVGLNFNFGGGRVVETAPEPMAPPMAAPPPPPEPAPAPPP